MENTKAEFYGVLPLNRISGNVPALTEVANDSGLRTFGKIDFIREK